MLSVLYADCFVPANDGIYGSHCERSEAISAELRLT